MNLKELNEKFDAVAAAVEKRLRESGQDSSETLDYQRSRFMLQAVTVPGDPPLIFHFSIRQMVQSSATADEIADRFIQAWRQATRKDEAL